MILISPYKDFVDRTLGALEGTWKKLVFVAGLRTESGDYEHWGLEYTYGGAVAKNAIAQAHSEVFQTVLETPLPSLSAEYSKEEETAQALLKPERMIPKDRNGASPEHFRYVLEALTLLEKARSTRQAA